MEYWIGHQSDILLSCGFASIFMALFVMVMRFRSIRRKKALIKVELGVGILMIADAFAYMYNGEPTSTAYWIVRIANFVVFMMTIADVYFLCEYITNLFMETAQFEKLPKRLLFGFVMTSIGMSLVLVSQFTGMYYYFDESNTYIRGPLFLVSCVLAFAVMIVLLTFVVQYRKLIGRGLFWALCSFEVLPVIAGVVQMYWNDLYLIDYASWVASVLVFFFALMTQNQELSKAAFTEVGTGLPNADGYLYELGRIINYGDITQYTAFYFDIVRMSHINNKYGKAIGDKVIRLYAEQIKNTLEPDEILGRLGGNYFVALLKNEHQQRFLDLLQDVPIEVRFEGHREVIHVAAITGAYAIDTKNITEGQILGCISMVVTYAKNVAHKPVVFYDKELAAELEKTRTVEADARRGLALGEFLPYYQPKVDASTNTLCGAEALVRWRHNDLLVPPYQFIPIMERNDSICNLDFYMLEQVCQDIKNWIAQGMEPVQISVNFSRKNLGNPILAEAISKVVEKYEIPKELIQIEVTETLDEFPMSYLVGVVEAIKRYGMTTAIDDFGVGSSSINLLKTAKFDILKIDKSFVDYTNEKEKQLLLDIVRMVKNIGIDVIAEGVEDPERVTELSNVGCTKIQGYVYDKPLEKTEFEKRLINKKYT